jgi:hypothetical protein
VGGGRHVILRLENLDTASGVELLPLGVRACVCVVDFTVLGTCNGVFRLCLCTQSLRHADSTHTPVPQWVGPGFLQPTSSQVQMHSAHASPVLSKPAWPPSSSLPFTLHAGRLCVCVHVCMFVCVCMCVHVCVCIEGHGHSLEIRLSTWKR